MLSYFSLASLLSFITRLMSGGTLEIILLIVLIVVGLILLLVALWLLWKLLVLLGKGLLWLFRTGMELARGRAHTLREARLAAPPAVATGWRSSPRIGLRKALSRASRLAGPDAYCIVVVAGEGMSDLCRSLGLTPPGVGTVGIAAGDNTVLIDASSASDRALRRLARALPWRRPVDGLAVIVDSDGIPPEALTRAAAFARSIGMRVATHLVLPSSSKVLATRIVDSSNRDGDSLCAQLASDTARIWLAGGPREGLNKLALAQSRDLPAAMDRALASASASVVDIASFSFSGEGLRAGVIQTLERTQPASAPGLMRWVAAGALVCGAALAGLTVLNATSEISALRAAVESATREASTSWTLQGVDTLPDPARVRRIAGLSMRLSEISDFSLLAPFAPLAPNHGAPRRLSVTLLDAYVLRPLAASLDRNARERLAPSDDPERWLDDARVVGEWLSAWEGLAVDPQEVDIRRLFVDVFGGERDSWPEGVELVMARTGVRPPMPEDGGLQIDRLTELARENFVFTMQRWADAVYTNGPVALAARRAIDRSTSWREQHAALVDLRTALQDPSQQWLTATNDRPDHRFELQVLGRAVAMRLFGGPVALEAKSAVSAIRIEAREAAEYFVLPDIGPLMTRTSTGGRSGGGGQSLVMTPAAMAWLAFLDRIGNSGLSDLPAVSPRPLPGLVTVDPISVADARRKLQVFDQFATNLPADLPPAIAQDLIRQLTGELVIGITISVEQALRAQTRERLASEDAVARSAAIVPALDDMAKIEEWLFERHAGYEADRVSRMRARVAESALAVSFDLLTDEDPLDLYIDPAADHAAVIRRYERGLTRVEQIYDSYAAPFIPVALQGGSDDAALQWSRMERDMLAYRRGDADAALSGMEGMLRAYADNPAAACAAPRVQVSGRDDYLARALRRLHARFEAACTRRDILAAEEAAGESRSYFVRHVVSLWPYSVDENARELAASTLTEFVTRLHASRESLAALDHPLVEHANFWNLDDDGHVAIRFRIDWRVRPNEERLAEHLIQYEIQGAKSDKEGVYTWRYGTPLSIRLQLAKNSRYRFATGDDPDQRVLEKVVSAEGNGALIRIFEGLVNGAATIRAEVVDEAGSLHSLAVTARVTDADARPISLPNFSRIINLTIPG